MMGAMQWCGERAKGVAHCLNAAHQQKVSAAPAVLCCLLLALRLLHCNRCMMAWICIVEAAGMRMIG